MVIMVMLTVGIFGGRGFSDYVCESFNHTQYRYQTIMKDLEIAFRLLRRHLSLRLVNLAGLSVVLATLLISVNYVRRELSWDRYNREADRTVRLTLASEGDAVDGRVCGNMTDDPIRQMPGVEAIAKLHEVYRPDLRYQGVYLTAGEKVFYVNRDFLKTFDIEMLEGDMESALVAPDQVIISESLARKLAGMQVGTGGLYSNVLNTDLLIEGEPRHIAGIFRDIPETSHWRGDALSLLPEDMDTFCYTYLLLRRDSDIKAVESGITSLVSGMTPENAAPLQARLMPLTDIHLHSHNLRELSVNGNIFYIWLTVGANALLLIVVLFNLWLNNSLIFSYNRRLYQLLRLHGAPVSVILRDEAFQAMVLVLVSVIAGLALTAIVYAYGWIPGSMTLWPTVLTSLGFVAAVIAVALIPAVRSMALTRFLNTENDSRPVHFSYGNVRWMLTVQYAVVISVLILAIGISRQLTHIAGVQPGGDGRDVLVMSGLPETVMDKYPLLRERFEQSPLIRGVTTSFQLPGDAIRDHVSVRCGGSPDWVQVPVMVAGDGFLRFYGIPLIAGRDFSPLRRGVAQEQEMLRQFFMSREASGSGEEYIVNRKALALLGFSTPEEAIGQPLNIRQGTLDYIDNGVIVGVAEDYSYTGAFEEASPLIMLHRSLFQFCLMVRIDASSPDGAMQAVEEAWDEVYPDRQSNFVPLSDIYGSLYRNEMNAKKLVLVFTFLCFLIADLGLIIFMAFIIRRRTKEIAVRKVNGATAGLIVRMLNTNFVRYIAVAFVIAVPVSWLILHNWLRRFAYRTGIDWWIFAVSGAAVLFISLLSVSLQSWRAATVNPASGLRK